MSFATAFAEIDRDLAAIETRLPVLGEDALPEVLEPCIALVDRMMRAYLDAAGAKAAPPPGTDVLDVWKALVKGDPTWNAIRDNCRELVFYRNCLAAGRPDSLPAAPQRMAVRTARHIYLYVRTRAVREERVND